MRKPAQYRSLLCICEKTGPDDTPMMLTYSKDRGFFEPVTNQLAEPVVGKVLSWKYHEAWECPIERVGCTQNCGDYGCGN